MPQIAAGGRIFDVDLVAFDKDGTLIDFYHLWGRRARAAVDAVVARVGGDAALADALYRSIGYDAARDAAAADGPLAIASMPKLYTICAAVLYQGGLDWHAAEVAALESFGGALGALPTAELVQPIEGLDRLFRELAHAGIKIAIVTSDDRAATLATLAHLGVADKVAAIVCGNDPIANKPAPDGLFHVGAALAIAPARMAMVGDTIGDMATGLNAGVAGRIAVLSGTGRAHELEPHADAVIPSIEAIRVLG